MVMSMYGVEEEQRAIWVFLEQAGSALAGVSLELLSKGRQMADQNEARLVGLLAGNRLEEQVNEAFAYGADEIVLLEHPLLEDFTVEGYTQAINPIVQQYKPSIFLLGATPNGRDLAGRLAVQLRTGLTADCTDLRLTPETFTLISEVSGFGGGVLALIEAPTHRPQLATVRPGVFPVIKAGRRNECILVRVNVQLSDQFIRTKVIERSIGETLDLTRAPVLVVGGRGIEGDFPMLKRLADLLGGDVGATRPPVDDGYIERQRQIGQTGVVCRPQVAIVCGVSGAFHFVVGIQDAETVIAINSDPDAPIFDYADYCIVGDAAEIVPALIQALESVQETAHG